MSGPADDRAAEQIASVPFGIDWSERRAEHAPSTKVGIVMRTRDRPRLLPRAIASVTGQTFGDWHLVIVNHGGEPTAVDQAVAAAGSPPGDRIEVVHLDPAGGMERASNEGLTHLDAEYIAIHDDDDTWMPRFLERTVEFLDDPEHRYYGAVVTQAVQRWETLEGEAAEPVIDNYLTAHDEFVDTQRLLGWNRFLPIAMLVRAAAFDVVGRFNEHLPVVGDWDFNIRLAAVTDIGLVPEPLARYHLRAGAATGELDSYGNSITASEDRHLRTDAAVRGALLRQYLAADRSRLGLLVALAHDDEAARQARDRLHGQVADIDRRTHHTSLRIHDTHDRLAAIEHDLAQLHQFVDRLHGVLATIARPARPLRVAHERWRLRRR